MEIQYASNIEAAQFGAMIHSDSELAQLFGMMMLLMDADTDYDTVMVGFEDEDERIMRVVVEDSPYTIIMDELDQRIYLQQDEKDIYDEEFNEDGVESIVDMIASRILGEDYSAS